VPAAAVIPAPIAYIKVVAVKKLVVGSVSFDAGSPHVGANWRFAGRLVGGVPGIFVVLGFALVQLWFRATFIIPPRCS
jgi:hypothetical protein